MRGAAAAPTTSPSVPRAFGAGPGGRGRGGGGGCAPPRAAAAAGLMAGRGREQLELERLGEAARAGSCPPPSPPPSACSRQAWSRDNPGFEPEEEEAAAAAAAAGPVLEMDVEWGSPAASLGSGTAGQGGGGAGRRQRRRLPAGRGGAAEPPSRLQGPPDGAAPHRAAWAKRLAGRLRGETGASLPGRLQAARPQLR